MRLEVGGAAGEYVLARYLDRSWNAAPTDFVGSVDVGIRTGYPLARRWDVKRTPRDDGSLLIPAWTEPRVDLAYALVVGEPPNLPIIGSLDGKRCRDCPITTAAEAAPVHRRGRPNPVGFPGVILLATANHDDVVALVARYPNLGRLAVPIAYGRFDDTAAAGIAWAADNGCYHRLDEPGLARLLAALDGVLGCRFVACADFVGDADATLGSGAWGGGGSTDSPSRRAGGRHHRRPCPMGRAAAVFVGGTTEFKLSPRPPSWSPRPARGAWTHMGRVNSDRRIAYAKAIGCDSIDGSNGGAGPTCGCATAPGPPATEPQRRIEDA